MEKILKIEEIKENYIEGYHITTDKQIIKLLLDVDQQCCENVGHLMSEDNLDEFVGAELLEVVLSLSPNKPEKLEARNIDWDGLHFDGNIIFVTLLTSNGVLQFVAYNEHNGYYGHDVEIISEQLTHRQTL